LIFLQATHCATSQVDADVNLALWSFCHREQRVKTCDAVDLGWCNIELLGDVINRATTDPTDAVVYRMQGWQQHVAQFAHRLSSE
jgi:hypothetical protein